MDLHLLSEWSDQVLNLVLFDSRKNRAVKVSIFQSFMAYEVQNWIIYEVDGVDVAMIGFNKIALYI